MTVGLNLLLIVLGILLVIALFIMNIVVCVSIAKDRWLDKNQAIMIAILFGLLGAIIMLIRPADGRAHEKLKRK